MAGAPRVAIVGGGITGSLCALVLQSRGVVPVIFDKGKHSVGGRLGQQRPKESAGDTGAHFLRVSDNTSPFAHAVRTLHENGLIAPWKGRFGMLGSRGGFLPSEVIGKTTVTSLGKGEAAPGFSNDGDDFCGFITGNSSLPLFTGTPSMHNICAGLSSYGDIQVHNRARIASLRVEPDTGTWSVYGSSPGNQVAENICEPGFQAVVIASHDPSFAAGVVRQISSIETDLEHAQLKQRLGTLATSLQELKDHHTAPVITLSAVFPAGSLSGKLPFDAASCPSSPHLQLVVREASKPGRQDLEPADGELWTAVSTSSFAQELLEGETSESSMADKLGREFMHLLSPFFDGDASTVPSPVRLSVNTWKAGFNTKPLGLQEDCVVLEPWRLAICGDYLRQHASPIEAAALSGMSAGERVAAWFAASPKEN